MKSNTRVARKTRRKPMLHQENDKTVKYPKKISNYFYLAVVDLKKLPNHQLYLKIFIIWSQC